MVEQRFAVMLGGFTFKGFIDRVDLIPGTRNEIEIIDYKTGKYECGGSSRIGALDDLENHHLIGTIDYKYLCKKNQ